MTAARASLVLDMVFDPPESSLQVFVLCQWLRVFGVCGFHAAARESGCQ